MYSEACIPEIKKDKEITNTFFKKELQELDYY